MIQNQSTAMQIAIFRHRASEVSLDSYLGEKLDLMIKIKRASALPRKLCSSVSLRPHLRIIRVLGGIRHMDR